MNFTSFGCCFVWGNEMRDTTPTQASNSTWPALLAQHLKLPYECHAQAGHGNFSITNQVLDQIATDEPALYVINWTWIDRFDYLDPNYQDGRWNTFRPGAHGAGNRYRPESTFYYRCIHSELRDKLTSLQNIKLVAMELESVGQPFIMTYMDDLLFDQRWNTTPSMLKQQEYLKSRMHTFNGDNMVEYAKNNGHNITPAAHPLEPAHRDLFNYALTNFGVDKI